MNRVTFTNYNTVSHQLSRFLNAMETRGVIKVEEQSKGVERITNVEFKHPM